LTKRSGVYTSTTSPRWLTTSLRVRTRPRLPLDAGRFSMTSPRTWIVSPTTVGFRTSISAFRNASPVNCMLGVSSPSEKAYTSAPGTTRPLSARSAVSCVLTNTSSVNQMRLMNDTRSVSVIVRPIVRKRKPGGSWS
jgi:hypothetical protein